MKVCVNQNRRRQGSALGLAVIMSGILGIFIMAALKSIQIQNQRSARAFSWNLALPAAEAGVDAALAHLNSSDLIVSQGWSQDGANAVFAYTLNDQMRFISRLTTNTNWPPVIHSMGFYRLPNSTNFVTRELEVTTKKKGFYQMALVAREGINLSGQNPFTDSYDSGDPNHSTGGYWDFSNSKSKGDIGSLLTTVNCVDIGGAHIYGTINTGPGGTLAAGSGSGVGTKEWQTNNPSQVNPENVRHDLVAEFPIPEAPYRSGARLQGGTVAGTNYTCVLGATNYITRFLRLSGQENVIVTNRAVLYVEDDFIMTGGASFTVAPGGSLTMYVGGRVDITGIGNLGTSATNCTIFGLQTCTSVKLGGNGTFLGVINAPNADLELGGGGRDQNDFCGAAIVKSATFRGHFDLHYDEQLEHYGSDAMHVIDRWKEL